MKIITTLLLFFSLSAHCDLTSFEWTGDAFLDENGVQVAAGNPISDYVALTLFSDLNPAVSGNQIDISSISGATFHPFISPLEVVGEVPPTIADDYFSDLFNGDGSFVGTAYLLIHKGDGNIQVGDFIGLSTASFTVNDLQPTGTGPVATSQTFDGGIITSNIEVIPEPSTILVILLSIAGLVGFRKHLR